MTKKRSWQEVHDIIHARILNRGYLQGQKLPKDSDLAEELGCARITVHRAMQVLSDNGLVERRRKGGTTVIAQPVTRAIMDIPVIRREIERRGAKYGYHLLSREIVDAPFRIAQRLPTKPGLMLWLRAIFYSDNTPYIFENRWISIDTIPEIAEVDFKTHSANRWLVEHKPFDVCDLSYAAQKAGAAAEFLDCEPEEALLYMERTTWIKEAHITTVHVYHRPGYQIQLNALR